MENFIHKNLMRNKNKWFELTFLQQMANVGSEVLRAINWRKKGKTNYAINAIERALELLYLTIEDPKNKSRLKELTRLREVLIDYFYFDNSYGSTDELWYKYFYAFNYAVSLIKSSV